MISILCTSKAEDKDLRNDNIFEISISTFTLYSCCGKTNLFLYFFFITPNEAIAENICLQCYSIQFFRAKFHALAAQQGSAEERCFPNF